MLTRLEVWTLKFVTLALGSKALLLAPHLRLFGIQSPKLQTCDQTINFTYNPIITWPTLRLRGLQVAYNYTYSLVITALGLQLVCHPGGQIPSI